MNVMFTTYCNQNCRYCFGQDAMNGKTRRKVSKAESEISANNLQFILDFLRRSKERRINIIGGEPTLHSEFEHRYMQIERAGLKVFIFSNCVMKEDLAIFLSRKRSLEGILLNIREPEEYSAEDWNKILATLKHNKRVTLSFRIYRLGFNLGFLFDLIDEFKLERKINFAPALPNLYTENSYLSLNQYKKMARELVQWSQESKKRKIDWYSDAGFILCGFSQQDLFNLRQNTGFVPNTNCQAAVEVKPNLETQRCFGIWGKTDESPVSLREFTSLSGVHRYFNLLSTIIKQRYGAKKECKKCVHFYSAACGGGCMVHILKKTPALCKARIFSRH